jgi:hypothetical protein
MFHAILHREKFKDYFGIVTQADFSNHRPQDDDYWNFVAQLSNSQHTAISWNGNQHNIHFLVDSGIKFNSVGLNQKEDFPFVTLSRIQELFKPTFTELKSVLQKFNSKKKLCLLGTPPSKSKKFLDARLNQVGSEPFFEDLGRKLGLARNKLRASDDLLRAYMWEVTQNLTEEISKEFGINYIPVPGKTYDSNKILIESFYTQDLTHANEDFGAVMLEEMLNFYGIQNG